MKKHTTAAAICLIMACAGTAYAQLGTGNSTIVDPKTLVWQNEHDLLVLLDDASDRIAVANAIVQVSASSGTLSDLQKYDGFRVAGTSLYHDRQYLEASSALENAATMATTNWEKAEALGAAAEAHLLGSSDRAVSLAKFQTAVDYFNISNANEVNPFSAEGAYRHLVNLAARQGDFAKSLQASLDAIALSAQLPNASLDLGFYKYSGARAAQELGDNTQAQVLYAEFLAEYPDYLNNQHRLAILPHAKVQNAIVNGSSWDHPDQALIDIVLGIIREPAYVLMPARASYAEKLADSLDGINAFSAAAAVRSELAKTTFDVIENLDASNHVDLSLGKLLWRLVAISQNNGARTLFYRQSDPVGALEFLDRVMLPSEFADPTITTTATALEAEIIAAP